MMKKYIVLTLLFSLVSMNISVQAMQSREEMRQQCAICLEEEENPRLEALLCGHEFHAGCLGHLIQNAFNSSNANFDQLKCPHFSSHPSCEGVLTRAQIDNFTSSSDGNAAILAFFDQRVHERANPQRIVFAPADAAELAAIAAGHLQICPGCNRRAHRIEGCNHMTCSTNEGGCGTHYCYPCGTRYNPAINGGIGWEARACACPHFPDWAPEPIPVPDGRGGALPQANPMGLIDAAWHGNLEIVLALINAGADVSMTCQFGRTALHNAANRGHLEVVHALLAAGIQVDTADQNGMTALQSAATQGRLRVVEVLIAAGADVNRVDFEFEGGNTILHYAASNGNAVPPEDAPLVVNVLLAAGARLNATTPAGRTALDYAAEDGNLPVVQALLAAGPNVSMADQNGMTVLHYAASRGHAEVVHALITAGADVNTPNTDGHTALQLATRNGHEAVVAAIQQHMDRHK